MMQRVAEACARNGWFVFPLIPRGKTPVTARGFYDATTDVDRVRSIWERTPDANIGLWPGPSGILVIDVDGPKGEETVNQLGLVHVRTLVCTTGRPEGGRHLYFRHPGFTVGNVTLGPRLDVRADAGYVILPPSIHPTGTPYRWIGKASDIAELPVPITVRLRQLEAERMAAVNEPPVLHDLPATSDTDVDKRVMAYLATVGNRAEGEGRNTTGYTVAAWLLRDMALPIEVAECYLAQWNSRNAPPLCRRELVAVFKSALKHGRRPRGSGREREAYRRTKRSGDYSVLNNSAPSTDDGFPFGHARPGRRLVGMGSRS